MTKTIAIDWNGGKKRVRAFVVGQFFAIHPNHYDRRRYNVTHIPTGYAAFLSVPSRKQAIEVARSFEALPVKWDFTDATKMPAMTKRRAKALFKRLIAEAAA